MSPAVSVSYWSNFERNLVGLEFCRLAIQNGAMSYRLIFERNLDSGTERLEF